MAWRTPGRRRRVARQLAREEPGVDRGPAAAAVEPFASRAPGWHAPHGGRSTSRAVWHRPRPAISQLSTSVA